MVIPKLGYPLVTQGMANNVIFTTLKISELKRGGQTFVGEGGSKILLFRRYIVAKKKILRFYIILEIKKKMLFKETQSWRNLLQNA